MKIRVVVAAIAIAIAANACAQHHADPQALADATARAVYDADLDRTTAQFDDALKGQVTRASIGTLSDQMHALGAYQGLKPVSSDPDKGRYDFTATFEKGTMMVQMRIDPDEKIGAFRVEPQS